MAKIKILIFCLLLVGLTIGCGSKGAPSGGARDLERPEILAISPDQFSDISEQDIEITFSKPIQKNSIFTGISIYPPILEKKYKWDGNNLSIEIREELPDSTNYIFFLNSSITCTHDNKLDRDYSYVFHTGQLNDYQLQGEIQYEEKTDYGSEVILNLFAADSTFIKRTTASSYYYIISDLNPEAYIIRSFIDKNQNGTYDANSEPFANIYAPYASEATNLLKLVYQDTVKPKIAKLSISNQKQLQIKFTEAIQTPSNIKIVADSTEAELPIIRQVLADDLLKLIVAEMDTLNYTITFPILEDMKNNISENLTRSFLGSTLLDTIPPTITSSNPRNGATLNTLKPKLEIRFSEIIFTEALQAELEEVESGRTLGLDILAGDSDLFLLQPQQKLRNLSSYLLKLDFTDSSNNRVEEKYELNFIPIIRAE
ncbi:MAG: Ig-like domain-containing protein [Candidatus Cloacimonadales bacterium]